MTENNLIRHSWSQRWGGRSCGLWTLWTETVSIRDKRHTQKERAASRPRLIYEDQHLLRVITHGSAWLLISCPKGPSAAALGAFKGWLQFSAHLSTLEQSGVQRKDVEARVRGEYECMTEWQRDGPVFFFSLPSGFPLFGDLLILLIFLLCVIPNKSAHSKEGRMWTHERN